VTSPTCSTSTAGEITVVIGRRRLFTNNDQLFSSHRGEKCRADPAVCQCCLNTTRRRRRRRRQLPSHRSALSAVPLCTQNKPERVERLETSCPVIRHTVQTSPSLYVINAAALSKPHAIEQLSVDLRNYNTDIAAVTETHFKAKHSDSIVAIPDYTLLRRDRIGRRGGVAVYVRTSFNAKIGEYSGDNRVFEVLWITIDDLFVGVVYHPPKPSYDVESFLDYLEAAVNDIVCKFQNSAIVMAGDFNQLSDTDLTQRTGLMQIVDQPTRAANTLDRILVSMASKL